MYVWKSYILSYAWNTDTWWKRNFSYTFHTQKDVFTIIWYLKLSVYVACKKKLNINCTITTKYATGLSLDVSYIQINKKKLNAYYIYFRNKT